MSLINKMLKDLESRDRASAKAPYEDLRPVHYKRTTSSYVRLLPVLLVAVVGLGAGAYFYFARTSTPPPAVRTMAPVSTSIAPVAAPVEVPAKVEVAAALPEPPAPEAKPVAAVKQDRAAIKTAPPAQPARAPVAKVEATKPAPSNSAPIVTADSTGKAVIEKHDRPIMPQEQAEARYREAAQHLSQGRAEDARATLQAALAAFPAHHKARELAAALAIQSGRAREAQDLLTQGMQLAPEQLSFAQLLARVYLEQGSEAQAIATLESVRKTGAGNADYLSFLAALYQRAGRHADAVKAYRETIAVRGNDARTWLGLGISLEATQDTTAAADAYTRALTLATLDANLAQYAQQRLKAIKN